MEPRYILLPWRCTGRIFFNNNIIHHTYQTIKLAGWSEIHLEWKLYIWEQAQTDRGSTNVLYEQIVSAFDILSLFSQPIFITSLWSEKVLMTNWQKRKVIWSDSQMCQYKLLALTGNELLPDGLEGMIDSSKRKSFWSRANHSSCIEGEVARRKDIVCLLTKWLGWFIRGLKGIRLEECR